MQKDKFMKALKNINKIEDLFLKADNLFNEIELEIQDAILEYHNETGTMQHCLRWGLQAAKDIRKDWCKVVVGIPCETMTQEARELYVYTTDHFSGDLERISISCVAPLIAIRQVVKLAINQYIKDYCCDNDEPFSREDFESVSRKILSDKKA